MWPIHDLLALEPVVDLCVLVNLAALSQDSFDLRGFGWLVVPRKCYHFASSLLLEHSSAIAGIGDVASVIHNQHDNGAGARPLVLPCAIHLVRTKFKKKLLRCLKATSDSLDRVEWEIFVFDDLPRKITKKCSYHLVQVIFEEIGAHAASMSIVNPEKRTFRPLLH